MPIFTHESSSSPDRRTFLKAAGVGLSTVALAPLLDPLAIAASPLTAPHAVGLIGAGRQGREIIGELQKIANVTIAAVCDADESRLANAARRAEGAAAIADHRALLERAEIEAVIIATPTHTHRAIALDAIAAGKHVYCESPLAATIDDCDAIAKHAGEAKTIFHTGMHGRSNPIYNLARKLRGEGIRDIVLARAQYHRKTTWRVPAADASRERDLNWRLDPERSSGLAGEFGAQQFDVFHWFLNQYPTKVRGSGGVFLHHDGRTVPDTIACSFTFPNGVTALYNASLANSFEGRQEILCGTMGTMKLIWTHGWMFKEADAPTQGWEVYANRQDFPNREQGITLIAEATKLAAQGKLTEGVGLPESSLHYALSDFLKSIDTNAPAVCDAAEGARAAKVAILANQAITTGAEVAINVG
jgi:predicted dehydrogenase